MHKIIRFLILSFLTIFVFGCSPKPHIPENATYPYVFIENGQRVVVGRILPEKHDADSFFIEDLIHVRLKGIDAFEYNQYCQESDGALYKCGEIAKNTFKKLVQDQLITCSTTGKKDSSPLKRVLAHCATFEGKDIARELIRAGWAVSSYGDEYKSDEVYARQNKLGAWNGTFKNPDAFRDCKGGARNIEKVKKCSTN